MRPVQTLDSQHKSHLAELEQRGTERNALEAERDRIQEQLKTCETKAIPALTQKLNAISLRIDRLPCTDSVEYYLQAGPVLFEYYKNIDDVANGFVPCNDKKGGSTHPNHRSILDYFQEGSSSSAVETESQADTQAQSKASEAQTDRVETTEYRSRNDLLAEYMALVKNEVPYEVGPSSTLTEEELYTCSECGHEMMECQAEAYAECPQCGMVQSVVIDVEKPWYKEPPREVSNYSYKRSNHFNEHVAYFQAKETTRIPQLVIDKVLVELNKNRVKNIAKLSHEKIREILRKVGLSKYYEHVPHILNQLNGVAPPVMSRETEERLRLMFREIQLPFAKHCPRDRKNFLSYSYVLHKFVELLELDQFKPCFPLLKSREKLHAQDIIWEKICNDLGWQFIKSI